ncbi:MAG TPA: MHYT domain-containing protein [Thermoanaerobaculia bacterium]
MTAANVVLASHDHRLVALSVIISILAAYAARDLAERVRATRGRAWIAWLVGAATAGGIGTWSMHYTGKLALRLPVPVQFDWRVVVLSLLIGIFGSFCALIIVGRGRIGWGRAIAAGVCVGGVGISGLHYTAMAALRLPGVRYDYSSRALVILSIVAAIVLSSIAVVFLSGDDIGVSRFGYHGGAIIRGLANPVMHYTAMAAVTFRYSAARTDTSHLVSISSLGIVGISIVPVMVLVVALLTSLADRLQKQRVLLDELFEQAPQAVALMDGDDRMIRTNREFTRLFGYDPKDAVGRRLSELILPDQWHVKAERYANLAANGERVDVEVIRQRKDGRRLQVSMVRVPVSVPSGQVETYAIFSDITERKRAEEALRTFPRRLIEIQETERQQMARELHDEIGQVLTSVGMMLTLSKQLPPDQAQARVAEARSLLNGLIAQVRNLALDLRPAMLDDFGLVAALQWLFERYVAQTGVRVDFKQHGLDGTRLGAETETAAYRIVQEALTNVARHAEVNVATVEISAMNDVLRVEIEDRGVGFDPQLIQSTGHSVGLAGMRERANILGGHLTIETSSGAGTRITAELPLSRLVSETSVQSGRTDL